MRAVASRQAAQQSVQALNSRLERLQSGDHVCLLHETEQRWGEFVSAFVRGGITRGEKVLLLSGKHSPARIMDVLQGEGLEPVRRIYSGQVVIIAQGQTSETQDFFDSDRVLAFLRRETSRANLEGYGGLRVTGDLTSLARSIGENALLKYEARLADFFATHSAIVACQYDRNCFSDEFLLSMLDLHPIVVSEGRLLENRIFYSSFHESSGPAAASYKLQERLKVLGEWNYAEKSAGDGLAWIQKLASAAPIGVFLMDRFGSCVYVNDQWCEISGMAADGALGMGWTRSIYPDDADLAVQSWMRAVGAGSDFEGEYRLRKDMRWVSTRARTLRGDKGEITGYLGITQDIGKWVFSENELRESKRWFSSVFRALPVAVAITEVDSGRYLDVNDAFERFSGFSLQELLGKTPVDLGINDFESLVREKSFLLAAHGAGNSICTKFRTKGGAAIPVIVTASLIGSRAGPCILSVIVPADLRGSEFASNSCGWLGT